MDAGQKAGQVVFTNRARCRDCYRCLRACPVKAIRMHKGQAFVVEERCISCGTCIRECPQHAKTFRHDADRAARLIASGAKTSASIAPSFAAAFTEWEQKRLPGALRRLGFRHIAETSIGAFAVAHETARVVEQEQQPHICTACPAVVTYVERYQPDLVPYLVPVVSPMVAHGKHIKQKLGPETKVVFIGPCVAKKEELARNEAAGAVDCVLTFAELRNWLEEEGIDLAQCEESDFDDKPAGDARYFPLPGGLARTAALHADYLDLDCIPVSGVEDLRQALDSLRRSRRPVLIEPLFCSQGCVNGPGMGADSNVFDRRGEVIEYAEANPGVESEHACSLQDLTAHFVSHPVELQTEFSEEEIASVLSRTGKANPDDQLNCGSCGYSSCREKAIAVLQGMAEPEMCIPFMRRLAEQRTDRIIETSPNGIVILDDRLNIIGMNPAFRAFFMCTDAVLGKPISYLMDPALFEQLLGSEKGLIETTVRHDKYNLACHQLLYALPEDRQLVGIFVNITRFQANEKQLERLRSDTVRQAHELMEHQVLMAQQLAQFLGESTARSEELLRNMINLAAEKPKKAGDHWM
ncbi:MAG: 4Fe-4S binding protein [Candidatus Hydrogenedentes bacterium]|nr:4Fe-4S binding protein [Candidatus Hydrogenedentota bacterium]